MVKNILICLIAAAIVGCNADGDLGTQVTNAPVDVEARIAEIQNDPKLPQPAKDAQINELRSRAQSGKAQSEAIQKSKP